MNNLISDKILKSNWSVGLPWITGVSRESRLELNKPLLAKLAKKGFKQSYLLATKEEADAKVQGILKATGVEMDVRESFPL